MKKFFSLSFQHKVILAFLLFMNLPFLLTGYMAANLSKSMILQEKQDKLIALAVVLDTRLDPGGYQALLRKRGAENAPRDEQIRILNEELSAATDEVGFSSPGLGVGYYSLDLDAILTYGPSDLFGGNMGVTIPPTHPGRIVMSENRRLVSSGSMVRGDIMNAMIPINRNGRVIGYIWANELTTDISAQISALSRNIVIVMLLCFGITVGLLLLLARRTVRDADSIIKGLRSMRKDIAARIPPSDGQLGEVVNSINAMAEDIQKANEETGRAISVLQSVMGNVEAAVYVCDPAGKTLVYVNEYLTSLLGGDDLRGRRCHEALHGLDHPCPFCPEKRLFDEEGRPLPDPVRWEMRHELTDRDFLVTDRLVTWHDGSLLHMQVGTDITERKALALAEAANLAQREFLARMSHEIRTPMNGVLGMTQLALKADPPPVQRDYLKKIQSSASLLLGIINDILDFSRIEAGKISIEKHPFNLHELVENIRELILPRTREQNLDFHVRIADTVPQFAIGDELRLSQVLLNLLGNASKFTLEGFISLTINAARLPNGHFRLIFTVGDSGIGMSREEQDALFTPFSQADISTSRKFGGTGLGLSISKALVELMGGTIGLTSEPGKGSAFTFSAELEPFDGNPESVGDRDQSLGETRYDGLRFLLVEDNVINQEISLAILRELGARADVADNGKEAVEAFMATDYDLILMDVRMPVMDGLEATRRIRAAAKHDARTVPIIAMTANAMAEDRQASKEAGMNGHIAKPIDVAELKSVLYRALKSDGLPG